MTMNLGKLFITPRYNYGLSEGIWRQNLNLG